MAYFAVILLVLQVREKDPAQTSGFAVSLPI
jgi:hypothetical protein